MTKSRNIILIGILTLALGASISGSAREIAIVGGTLIDGTGRSPIPNATLVIGEDGKIKQVSSGQPSPAGAEVIHAEGKYLIPGLWDMHVHYSWWAPELFLHYGVTTIQDVGSDADWILAQRDGIAKGKIFGPRIFACGDMLGVPKDLEGVLTFRAFHSVEEARRVAKEELAKGVDCLKVWRVITPDQTKALAEEAHRMGKPVVGHATSFTAVVAAQAGIDQLAHMSGVAEASQIDTASIEEGMRQTRESPGAYFPGEGTWKHQSPWNSIDPGKNKAVLQVLLKKGVFVEPDLVHRELHEVTGTLPQEMIDRWNREDSVLYQDPNLQYIPKVVRVGFQTAIGLGAELLTPEQRSVGQRGYHKEETFLAEYVKAGGKVLTGTDTTSLILPGISLQRELELLVRAGLTPMQAIQAGTYNCALFQKKENELGSLQVGRYADLIILDGDPLADIKNTRNISAVYKEGKLVDRAFHANFSNPIPEPNRALGELIAYPRPKISKISPTVATEGAASVEIQVTGSGFVRKTTASLDGHSVPTKRVSTTELKLTVPGELLARAGTFPVIVTNPIPVVISDPLHDDEKSNVKYFMVRFK
jgi:imidazolonepropionase-like amidohydrolase